MDIKIHSKVSFCCFKDASCGTMELAIEPCKRQTTVGYESHRLYALQDGKISGETSRMRVWRTRYESENMSIMRQRDEEIPLL